MTAKAVCYKCEVYGPVNWGRMDGKDVFVCADNDQCKNNLGKSKTLIEEAVRVEYMPEFSDEKPWAVLFQNEAQCESFHFSTKDEAKQLADSTKKMLKWVIEETKKA